MNTPEKVMLKKIKKHTGNRFVQQKGQRGVKLDLWQTLFNYIIYKPIKLHSVSRMAKEKSISTPSMFRLVYEALRSLFHSCFDLQHPRSTSAIGEHEM